MTYIPVVTANVSAANSTTTALGALTVDQIDALTPLQISGFTPDQINSLTVDQQAAIIRAIS